MFKRNTLYDPKSKESFRISRAKIESFMQCPRCFYMDRRLGIAQPPSLPFTLNNAVDNLFKNEFDAYRANQTAHPLMNAYGLKMRPFMHPMMEEWRSNFKGVTYFDEKHNFIVTGAIDDIWVDDDGILTIADYKATSSTSVINLEADYRISYKRQMEIYQWLFRNNGFKVSDTGYFVFANGIKDKEAFDAKLEFDVTLVAYKGDDSWVEGALDKIHKCLNSDKIPEYTEGCNFCNYQKQIKDIQ